MFPPPFSNESILSGETNPLTRAYRDVVVYDAAKADEPLYEGPIVVHANGWLELEGNRLLSPSAVHHIDIYDDERAPRGDDTSGRDERGSDTGRRDGRDGGNDDDRRTSRFSPR